MSATHPWRSSSRNGEVSPFARMEARLPETGARPRLHLRRAGAALVREDYAEAEKAARAGLAEGGGVLALRFMGLARERAGALGLALKAYEAAEARAPGDPDILRDLARLARRLNQPGMAADLLAHVRALAPGDVTDTCDMAVVLRDLDRCDEALDVIREALVEAPKSPYVWSLLGSIAAQKGDDAEAITFHEEALRLGPHEAPVLHNMGLARLHSGEAAGACDVLDAAMAASPTPPQAALIRQARATARLCLGQLDGGWADYAARLEHRSALTFDLQAPRWKPPSPFTGGRLLLVGEQGLGDEVMFGSLIPDVLKALGREGRLILAVEPRLVRLFAEAFPTVHVVPHKTISIDGRLRRSIPVLARSDVDLWAPIGDLLPVLRGSLDRFKPRAYLPPAPREVMRWRAALAAEGDAPKIGIIWKSLLMTGLRTRSFAPFEAWAPALRTPGMVFVNLQYGHAEEERAWAARELGVDIVQPQGLDLMQDLDGLAGLCGALDLVIGAPTATTNLAAAGGTETWMVCAPNAWPALGTGGYPWYSNTRAFIPTTAGDWQAQMSWVAAELAKRMNGCRGA